MWADGLIGLSTTAPPRHHPHPGPSQAAPAALPTEGILYAGAPLTGLAVHEAFTYLGVRANLVGVVRSRRPETSGKVARQRRRGSPAPCLAAIRESAKVIACHKIYLPLMLALNCCRQILLSNVEMSLVRSCQQLSLTGATD